MNQIDLRERVAVVTGGAGGIGRAIVARFRDSGARVVVWDLDPQETAGPESQQVDVTDYGTVEAARDATLAAWGRIDILVNNAGISGPTLPLADYDLDLWRRVIDINLVGTFHCSRAVVPAMRTQDYGRIVNMASLAGKEGTPNASAYSASKAGIIALTKSLAKELAGSGVLVNCIAPAAVDTDILKQMTEAHVASMLAKSPMGRFGRVEEVAALAAWLASEDCSFNSGATFDLSGGRAVY